MALCSSASVDSNVDVTAMSANAPLLLFHYLIL